MAACPPAMCYLARAGLLPTTAYPYCWLICYDIPTSRDTERNTDAEVANVAEVAEVAEIAGIAVAEVAKVAQVAMVAAVA